MAVTEVVIGEIALDTSTKFESDTRRQSIYTDYMIHNRYEKDRHIYNMAVSSPEGYLNQTTAFVQLAAPTVLWIVEWSACRYDNIPDIPDPEDIEDKDWVLMDDHYHLAMITVSADGQIPLYRIEGTYVYANKSPVPETIFDTRFPRPPWLKDTFGRKPYPGNFKKGLIDSP